MRRIRWTFAAVVGPLCAGALLACATAQRAPPAQVTVAHQLVREGALLLDVRSPADYGKAHLPGALNLPLAELPARLAELPRDRTLVTYCNRGIQSAKAAALLRERGFQVHDLGAMVNWGEPATR